MTKQNKKLFLAIGFISLILLFLLLFLKSPAFRVELSKTEDHLEIGNQVSTLPSDYLSGDGWCVSLSYVDTSSVKHTKVGRYPIYIYHGFQKFTSYVNVTDTTAPTVSCSIKNKTLVPGETISVNSLGLKLPELPC